MEIKTIVFENITDLDLVHIFECGQCFRWAPAEDGSGRYLGAAGKYAARVSYEDGRLTLETTGGDRAFWRDYFDLDTDYAEIKKQLISSDPQIRPATEYGQGIRILCQDLFETMISFIISQNNNIPRIRKNIEALCAMYGEHIGTAFGRDWYAFPEPQALADAEIGDLADLKLGYRAGYIRSSAQKYLTCPAPECREDILSYHGIGPKVANCIMLFGLRCTDAFPVDTWVRYIMHDMYGMDEKNTGDMEHFAHDRFGDLAGYAQQYLFYYYRDRRK